MSWSVNKLGSATGTTSATSQSLSGITAASGALVVAVFGVSCGSGVTGFTCSDSAGNSYTVHAEANPATLSGYVVICYSVLANALSSGSITLARTGTTMILSFCAGAVSAGGGSGSEDTAVLAVANGSSTSPAVTGNAATQSGDLLIAATGFIETATYAEDSIVHNWTNLYNLSTGTANDAGLGFAWQVNSGTAGIAYNPGLSVTKKWAVIQIGFAPAGLALVASGAVQTRGRSSAAFTAALSARAVVAAVGKASGSYAANLNARGAVQTSGRGAGSYTLSLLARGTVATAARALGGFAASFAARTLAAIRGLAPIAPPPPGFDPKFALLAPARTFGLMTPPRTFSLLTD